MWGEGGEFEVGRAEAVEEEEGGWLRRVDGEVKEEFCVLFGHFSNIKRD
jgi:hypothetical protein